MTFDIEKFVAKAAVKRISKAVVPEDYADVLKDKCLSKKDFNLCKRHCIQRIERGWSFRDAWNIDYWLAEKLSGIIGELERCTHGYPNEALDLHAKCRKIDFLAGKDVVGKRRKSESLENYKVRVYSHDLKRMAFLFGEYDETRCSKKNPIKPIFKYHYEPVPGKKGCSSMVDDCNPAEKRINERWHKKESELCKYRSDCLHIALKMLDIYIQSLWD